MSTLQLIFDIVIGVIALYSIIMGTINSILIRRRYESDKVRSIRKDNNNG